MLRRFLFAAGVSVVALAGAAQLASDTVAAPPPDCTIVSCQPCPKGYVLSPIQGNCCRCVRGR